MKRIIPLILGLCSTATVHAEVWRVTSDGSGDFTEISAAVATAAAGDTIEVSSGSYFFGVTLVGKGLNLVAAAGERVLVRSLAIDHVPAGQGVLVRGFDVGPHAFGDSGRPGLTVTDCDGLVWLEDCAFAGADAVAGIVSTTPGGTGAEFVRSGQIVASRCAFTAGAGARDNPPYVFDPSDGGHGISGIDSTLHLFGCTASGGDGASRFRAPGYGTVGGDGVRVQGGTVFLDGCSAVGGRGGNGSEVIPTAGQYAGGDGLRLTAGASGRSRDGGYAGGPAGTNGGLPGGPDGVAINSGGGTIVTLAHGHRSLAATLPTPEETTVDFAYEGATGDLLLCYVSLDAAPLAVNLGTWTPQFPFGPFLLGPVTSPGGDLAVSFAVPDLGLQPDEAVPLYLQAIVAFSGSLTACGPTSMLVTDG